jgi:hypothetical protein
MGRLIGFLGAVVTFAATTYFLGLSRWTLGIGMVGLSGALWFASKCPHNGPLGLLPPVNDADGRQIPARWFCPDCSLEWPAAIEHGHQPVMRFSGYDESKASAARLRASQLETQQRTLALARGGMINSSILRAAQEVIQIRPRVRAVQKSPLMKSAS